jgi:hypothetical protein
MQSYEAWPGICLHPVVDVGLEDGRPEIFWIHQDERIER